MQLDSKKRIVVTGGAGFLGHEIVATLRARGVEAVVPRQKQYDLRTWDGVKALFEDHKPEVVIHSAWNGGGIGFSREHPGLMARDNVLMATHVIEACRQYNVAKFVGVGSVCSYPKFSPVPFREEDLWNGYPEETNAAYGLAKRMMLVLTESFRQEYGLNGVHLLMVNLYGPRDNFDLQSGHVIPALIRKFKAAKDAGQQSVSLWGDGSPTREFVYITDAAEAVVRAAESYDSSEPVNVGSGEEISIRDLATTIARIIGYDGEMVWDKTSPNGQPRRRLDVTKAKERFGFSAQVSFSQGLQKTIDWYLAEGRQLWER